MTPHQPQRDVLIPVALDGAGGLVRCNDAAKGPFSCPGCGGAVVARRGTTRRWHFAHAGGGCSPETAEHAAAKMMLAGILGGAESRRGVRVPKFCAGCGRGAAVPLSLAFDRTSVEARIGAYVVDIALCRGERVVGAVEVRRTHAVGEAKARGLGVPWVELHAADILEDALVWKPVAGDLHRVSEGEPAEHVCAACEERLGEMAGMVGGVPVECAACGGVCAARWEGGVWRVATCVCGAPGRMPPEGSALGRAAARVAATGGSKGALAAYAVMVERMGW